MAKTFTPDEKTIVRIVAHHNLDKVNSIEHLEGGFSSPVISVNSKYIIKLNKGSKPLHYEKLSREASLYLLLRRHNAPVPDLIAFDTSKEVVPYYYIIISYLHGMTLKSGFTQLLESEKSQVIYNVGNLLAQIHKTPISSHCKEYNLLNSKDKWKEYILQRFDQHYSQFTSMNLSLSSKQREQVLEIRKLFSSKIEEKDIPKVLIHHDFNANHVITDKSVVMGVIDFEWSCLGDPLWDLQKLPTGFGLGEEINFSDFLKGYGKTTLSDNELIRLKTYCLDQGLWQIASTTSGEYDYPAEFIEQGYTLISQALNLSELFRTIRS